MTVERVGAPARPQSASRMHPKLMLTAARARRVARARCDGGDRRDGPRRSDPGRHVDHDPARRHGTAHRALRRRTQRSRAAPRPTSSTSTPGAASTAARSSTGSLDDGVQRRPRRWRSPTQLVEQDKVFAVFNSLGTAGNLAVRPYLNTMKVPQLFVASGATTWGRDYADLPVHDRLPAELPGRGMGLREVPRAHRAGRHDRGPVPERRLRQGSARRAQARPAALEGEGDRGAAVRPSAAVDVSAQIAKLKASGADTLAIFATPNVRGPGVLDREQARLEAEARDQQRGRRRARRRW